MACWWPSRYAAHVIARVASVTLGTRRPGANRVAERKGKMASCKSGLEALATGNFGLVPGSYKKETWGICDGLKVILLWDVRGESHNEEWQVKAVRSYQSQLAQSKTR